MHTGLEPPKGVWWKPAHKNEKVWVAIAFAWCLVLFAMMPLWHWKGGQNPSGIRSKVDPEAFRARTQEFIEQYRVGEDQGIAIVAPPPGSDVYLYGRMWAWEPILQLQANTEYTLHLSSLDLNHGFALYPLNINFQVVPGYDYGLKILAKEAGEFRIICNEYCGAGHHLMLGRVIVTEGTESAEADDAGTPGAAVVEPATAEAPSTGAATNAGGER
jgi:cytochrome c oxidase subunit 2